VEGQCIPVVGFRQSITYSTDVGFGSAVTSSYITSMTQVPYKLIHIFLHMYAGTVNYRQNVGGLTGSQQTLVDTTLQLVRKL
jgi:hypothetical protein